MAEPQFIRRGRLRFRLPGDDRKVSLSDDPRELHRQLVCWCLIQRYWYDVKATAKVTDKFYDIVVGYVAYVEDYYGSYLRWNPYSPTHWIGSTDPYDYPTSIRNWFKVRPVFKPRARRQ